jgi:hypothetical protein
VTYLKEGTVVQTVRIGVLTVQNRKKEKIGKIYMCSDKDCNKIFMNILRGTFFYKKIHYIFI